MLTQDQATTSNPPAHSRGSVPLPDRTEAQRILAEKTAETRMKREREPDQAIGDAVTGEYRKADPPVGRPPDQDESELRQKAVALWTKCGVPERYRNADLSKLSPNVASVMGPSRVTYGTAVDALKELLNRSGTVALLGERGAGKTWMSCGLVREFCKRGNSALYRDAMDYFLDLKATYDQDAKVNQSDVEARYLRPRLLVLDEVHERGDTAWEDRMLTRLINKRYCSDVSTVLISNQSPEEFAERIGKSIYDRMFDGGGEIVCDWQSLRGRSL